MMTLADRIKRYELVTHHHLTPKVPVIIRVDGKAFHTFTKHMKRPFDPNFMNAMVESAIETAKQLQGFRVGYVQSDEVTFYLTDNNKIDSIIGRVVETQGWFGYDLSKLISISAAIMSAEFSSYFNETAVFDSRAFNIPRHDIVNTLLWRAQDWHRNSLQMYAATYFSTKELHRKKRNDIHKMLHSIGKNWSTDLSDREKNGTFLVNEDNFIHVYYHIKPTYSSIDDAIGEHII